MLPFGDIGQSSELFNTVRIAGIKPLAVDTKLFELEPIGWDLAYKPGQFLTFVVPSASGLARRSYSLCSLPNETPSIVIKRVPNGVFSRSMLDNAEPGDLLTVVGGASGFFNLPDGLPAYDQLFFLAAGSGITPILPLIRQAIQISGHIRLMLAFSNSRIESALFRKELEELTRSNPRRLSIAWFFSNKQDLTKARLSKIALESILKTEMIGNPEKTLAYLCGPFDYMRMAEIVMRSKGIPAKNIKREVFKQETQETKTRPPDTDRQEVTITVLGTNHRLSVQYPETILAAARKAGMELPYSCESGRCGSCIASCTKGKVWMRHNEVLTDNEVRAGRILVCQSFPVGGDVRIEYE